MLDEAGLAARAFDFGDKCLAGFCLDVRCDDDGAFPSKAQRRLAADPLCRARDADDLVLKPLCHGKPPLSFPRKIAVENCSGKSDAGSRDRLPTCVTLDRAAV